VIQQKTCEPIRFELTEPPRVAIAAWNAKTNVADRTDAACPSSIMRVAILADTHGVLDPRIAEIVRECDCAVHAGDIGGASVLTALRPAGTVVAVRGNNDSPAKWAEDELDRLGKLPLEATLELPGGSLVVVHGDRVLPARERHERLRRHHAQARAPGGKNDAGDSGSRALEDSGGGQARLTLTIEPLFFRTAS
jgi:putative phosphoesterase